ncbi:MAG: tetratricopeptide repeat protein [Helicobacteraceae bacterium]|nr:tetratricopeptide repeat protein [Helicobacteraceae bacterium]
MNKLINTLLIIIFTTSITQAIELPKNSIGISKSSLNIRKSPSTNSAIVDYLQVNEKITILSVAKSVNGRDWYKIKKGFVSAKHINILKPSVKKVMQVPKTSTKDDYTEAKKLYKDKHYQKAYDSFYTLFENNLQDPNINFYLGQSAYQLKEYESAISAYERVLAVNDDSMRTKLELAKCYYELKDYKKAQTIFLETIKGNLPVNVEQNVNMYLQAINDNTKRNFFTGSLVVGINYDTNLYNRATDDIFTIPGLINSVTNQPIQVSNTTQNKGGFANQQALSLGHLYRMNETMNIKNDVILFNKAFDKHHAKDIQLFQYSPALSVTHHARLMIDYAVLYNKIWLKGMPLMSNMGIYPKLTYIYSTDIILSSAFKYQKKLNFAELSKDSNSKTSLLEGTISHIYSQQTMISLYAQLYRERKLQGNLTNVDNDMMQLSLSMAYKHSNVLSVTPKVLWMKKKFIEEDALYLKVQDDNEYQFLLNSMYTYKKNILFNADYMYTNHKSNIPSWEFDKHSITANVIVLF